MSCGAATCAFFGEHCESCARRRRYGVLVDRITAEARLYKHFVWTGAELDALDALAEIMEDRKRLMTAWAVVLSDALKATKDHPREDATGAAPAGVDPMSSTHRPEPVTPEQSASVSQQAAAGGSNVPPAADREGEQ